MDNNDIKLSGWVLDVDWHYSKQIDAWCFKYQVFFLDWHELNIQLSSYCNSSSSCMEPTCRNCWYLCSFSEEELAPLATDQLIYRGRRGKWWIMNLNVWNFISFSFYIACWVAYHSIDFPYTILKGGHETWLQVSYKWLNHSVF